ncbi:Protein MAIN-LIKE 1 [Glycine soja]
MIIMVRTRSLGRALDRVIGRALGKKDNRDSNDTPHRRRPTTSACRQWEVVDVVEDAPHVDHAAKEVFQHVEEAGVDAQDFLGGSCDTSVLTAYVDHVAERPELNLSSHGRKVQKFKMPTAEIEGLVATIGLSPLIACSLDTGDRGLISTFMESFYLPVREVTITLDDVAYLLHLPIIGAFHSFDTLHFDEVVLMLVELLEVTKDEARAETDVMGHTYAYRGYERFIIVNVRADTGIYTIFANKSAIHMHVVFLDAFRDLSHNGSYAWELPSYGDRQLAGYITLLQCWIYEHFTSIAEAFTDSDYDERSPHAYRWTSTKALLVLTYWKRLDRLTTVDACWMPYGDHERVVRQFGYVQMILQHCSGSRLCFKDIDDRWMHFSDYLAPVGQICVVPGQYALDYMDNPGDPPKHPSIMQDETYMEPDVLEYSVATVATEKAPAPAPSDVAQPRHAVEACQAIAEMLEWLLNLRIMTKGTEIYDVMQDCLRIIKGVTMDRNVYVRPRRRRRTDHA